MDAGVVSGFRPQAFAMRTAAENFKNRGLAPRGPVETSRLPVATRPPQPKAARGHLLCCRSSPHRPGIALVLTRPDVVRRMHASYFEAGADIVETDTFGGTPLVLAEYGLAEKAFEINKRAAELAREVAAKFATGERPRFVAGSMGPTTRSVT